MELYILNNGDKISRASYITINTFSSDTRKGDKFSLVSFPCVFIGLYILFLFCSGNGNNGIVCDKICT